MSGLMEKHLVTTLFKKFRRARPAQPAASVSYGVAGSMEVRLAAGDDEVSAAQALRYRVFYEEMAAQPTPVMRAIQRDFDRFDDVCDHLLVLDHNRPYGDQVVGTYRLLREGRARKTGFYSAAEYDISCLLKQRGGSAPSRDGQLLELGRSCVHRDYRTNAVINLLWRGIAGYLADFNISHMFGCASLAGTDPAEHKLALSYLHHNFRTPDDLRVRAQAGRFVNMNLLPEAEIDARAALHALPPLVKGYLRLGCYIGDGAVIDREFGTTDVFILLPVDRVSERYLERLRGSRETATAETRIAASA